MSQHSVRERCLNTGATAPPSGWHGHRPCRISTGDELEAVAGPDLAVADGAASSGHVMMPISRLLHLNFAVSSARRPFVPRSDPHAIISVAVVDSVSILLGFAEVTRLPPLPRYELLAYLRRPVRFTTAGCTYYKPTAHIFASGLSARRARWPLCILTPALGRR